MVETTRKDVLFLRNLMVDLVDGNVLQIAVKTSLSVVFLDLLEAYFQPI
jgi:hypothetical protein